jgi:hypothetical protein
VLTQFAEMSDGGRYAIVRLAVQLTPFRSRGPIRTFFVGKPKGPHSKYICSEIVIEGLILAGLIDREIARPVATYPRELFFDRSPNPYINRHPVLANDWEAPALWQRAP